MGSWKNRTAAQWQLLKYNMLHPQKILEIEVMHRLRSNSPLHIIILKTYQIRTEKQNASAAARCLLLATLLERWPQICRDKITFKLLRTTSFVSSKTNSMNAL